MSDTSLKILLTGSTGYIGGSVLAQLLYSKHPAIIANPICCLVRGEDNASKLIAKFGVRVRPMLFKDLEDKEKIIEIASQYDVVINTLLGYHPESAKNLVLGLAERKKQTGKDVYMIHTSGTSNLGDWPVTGRFKYSQSGPYNDAKDDIYGIEKEREKEFPYEQRTSELGVIDAGLEAGVKTLVIMSPTIYGPGTGEFNRLSIQVPLYARATLKLDHGIYLGEGKGTWDHVHVHDLAVLYELALERILDGNLGGVPFGKKGIIFSAAGRHTWGDVARNITDVLYKAKKIKSNDVKSVGLEEGVKMTGWPENIAELGFASNSMTESQVAREVLGWKPNKSEKDWEQNMKDEALMIAEKEEGNRIG